MKKVLVIIAGLLTGAFFPAMAQPAGEIEVGSVTARQNGTLFTINYDLSFGERVNWAKIDLYMSTDGGNTFGYKALKDGLSGDVGKITSSGFKTITLDVSEMVGQLVGRQIVFKVNVASKDVSGEKDARAPVKEGDNEKPGRKNQTTSAEKTYCVIAVNEAVIPQLSYGLTFGMIKKIGWYLKGRSNFCFQSSSYECKSDGSTSSGAIWANGDSKITRLTVTAGTMVKVAGILYPYAGAGYGSRSVLWQDLSGNWAKVSDYSFSGLTLDAGILVRLGKFSISAGITNTAFKFTEMEVGVGVMF